MCLSLPFNQIVSLAARGLEAREGRFFDPIARDLWESLEAHVDGVPTKEQMRRSLADTLAVDHVVAGWLMSHPGQPIVEIGACLSTRFARLAALDAPFVTVDEPVIAELRRELFDGEAASLSQLGAHLERADWLDRATSRTATCVVLEGVLTALHRDDAMRIVDNLTAKLARGSVVVATFDDPTRAAPCAGGSMRVRFGELEVRYPCLRTRAVTSRFVLAEVC